MLKLSIVIPIFNEAQTVEEIVARVQKIAIPGVEKELILVDDGSTDATRATLEALTRRTTGVKVLFHPRNQGKGAALRTGFSAAAGDIVLVQDADLEYEPEEYPRLIGPIISGRADVVFGSRFTGGDSHRVLYFWHYVGNKALTYLSNCFTNLNLSDMETGYKVFRREVLDRFTLEEDRFGIEPEITAKVAALKCRVYEVGVSYHGRTYAEGKKIGWKDGLSALWCILKYNIWRRTPVDPRIGSFIPSTLGANASGQSITLPGSRPDNDRRHFWLRATMLYLSVSLLYFVLPLGRNFGHALLGTSFFPHDSVLNAGILEWGYRSIWSPERHLFQWVAGFPLENSLAITENLFGWQLLYSPLRAIGLGVPASYNLLLVLSFLVSGLSAAALARHFGAERWGALAAGMIFAFTPFHLTQTLHLQTLGVCWSPLAILFLDRYLSAGRTRDAIGLSLAVVMTVWSAMNFAVFLAILLSAYAVLWCICRRNLPNWRILAGLAAAALACLIVLLPVLLPYVRFSAAHPFDHPLAMLARFSIHPKAFLLIPPWLWAWALTGLLRTQDIAAFPGMIAPVLALLFFIRAVKEPDLRAVGMMLGLLCAISILFSLGPYLGGIPLPGQIFQFLGVRHPQRMLLYAFLAGGVLCGLGLSRTLAIIPPRWHGPIGCLVLALLVLEYRPRSMFARQSIPLPPPLAMSDAYPFLAQEPDRGAVVEVPVDIDGYRTPMLVRYVYGSAGHLRRNVAIHGSILVPAVQELLAAAANLPEDKSRQTLVGRGVTRLVVHRPFMGDQKFTDLTQRLDAAGYPRLHSGSEAVVYALASH